MLEFFLSPRIFLCHQSHFLCCHLLCRWWFWPPACGRWSRWLGIALYKDKRHFLWCIIYDSLGGIACSWNPWHMSGEYCWCRDVAVSSLNNRVCLLNDWSCGAGTIDKRFYPRKRLRIAHLDIHDSSVWLSVWTRPPKLKHCLSDVNPLRRQDIWLLRFLFLVFIVRALSFHLSLHYCGSIPWSVAFVCLISIALLFIDPSECCFCLKDVKYLTFRCLISIATLFIHRNFINPSQRYSSITTVCPTPTHLFFRVQRWVHVDETVQFIINYSTG